MRFRRDLMEVLENCYDSGSMSTTSRLPVETWYQVIAQPTCADIIFDRLAHRLWIVM